jgi:hypothetical protein
MARRCKRPTIGRHRRQRLRRLRHDDGHDQDHAQATNHAQTYTHRGDPAQALTTKFHLACDGKGRPRSVVITALLLVLLGVGRARVAETPLVRTIVQTVGIATAAAAAGLLIGKLVTR